MKRYFWGVKFLGGNRTCTTGEANSMTGRMSKAIEYEAFKNSADRDSWISKEEPGEERIKSTRIEIRKLQLGSSIKDFNEEIENATWRAENPL